ncbi:hypothetical protein AAFX91_35935 [Bradyrhizobium sp. 31Argb]|uniref:hypothetical protein n=1 Tax=unclassified Bradyrhizobium TaxID=2631580 RepID=UPI001FE10F86|nr:MULTISPECIES: hypothetical protein [unclassified Bradyrhizobium]MDI4231566.1 hypothetical protein [Bradyrhizobium sp. Arg237L]
MKASVTRLAALKSRARRVSTLSLFLTLFAAGSGNALGSSEQRRACTPDVYRLLPAKSPT